jgi:hypothetical protein
LIQFEYMAIYPLYKSLNFFINLMIKYNLHKSSVGGSVARANEAKVSIIRLIQSN